MTGREIWHVQCTITERSWQARTANEMEGYKLSVLAVTETHLTESGQLVLDEVKDYKMLPSGRQDGKAAEGVRLGSCSPCICCLAALP